jgi:hypothetical protein
LLEVPFLPRAAPALWKRRRFGRPKWVLWAWAALGTLAVLMLTVGAVRFLVQYRRSAYQRSIHHLLGSSEDKESNGRWSEALIELDAALEMAKNANPPDTHLLDGQRARRRQLALQDAEAVRNKLLGTNSSSFPLGEWSELIARCARDDDLSPLLRPITDQFHASLRTQVEAELASARRSSESGEAASSLASCERAARLLAHIPQPERATAWDRAEKMVTQLLGKCGVQIETPRGRFVIGSVESYLDEVLPLLVTGLEAKGYLPYRGTSPWHDLWKHARYQMELELSEQFEGNYLSSENRLTRLEAHLTLTAGGKLAWQITPTARTTVPLPNLPAFVSGRLAAGASRSAEVEQLLYRDARTQIEGKVGNALRSMPDCESMDAHMVP